MNKAHKTLRNLLYGFYTILLAFLVISIIMVYQFLYIYKDSALDNVAKKADLLAQLVADSSIVNSSDLIKAEGYDYEQLIVSDENKTFQTDLQVNLSKYNVYRIYIYRHVEENEVKYYADESESKSYGYIVDQTPLDLKYVLEAVNNSWIREKRGDTQNRYQYNFFDQDLISQYQKNPLAFHRIEKDKWGSFLVSHRKIMEVDNHQYYVGVEIDLSSYYQELANVTAIAISMTAVVLAFLVIVLLIIIFAYRSIESKRIKEQANFIDNFTGLYNRHIRRKFKVLFGKNPSIKCIFMLIDVDNMAKINAVYTSKLGDEMLKFLAASIKSQLRGEFDIPMYLGEDDFAIIIRDETVDTAVKIAKRIIDDIHKYEAIEDLSISVGITFSDVGELTNRFNLVFSRADAAIFEAKTLNTEYKIMVKEGFNYQQESESKK